MIDLTAIPLMAAPPEVQDFGGLLTPPLGGPTQRIDRVGTRWQFNFSTPQMPIEPDGRLWASRLARAKTEGALVWVPEPDLVFAAIGTPVVASATTAGSSVPLSGCTAGRVIPEGKWVSFIHDARRYLYQVTAERTVAGDGTVTLPIFPMLRTSLAVSDVAELFAPKVQGSITGTLGWPLDIERFMQLQFTLAEDE